MTIQDVSNSSANQQKNEALTVCNTIASAQQVLSGERLGQRLRLAGDNGSAIFQALIDRGYKNFYVANFSSMKFSSGSSKHKMVRLMGAWFEGSVIDGKTIRTRGVMLDKRLFEMLLACGKKNFSYIDLQGENLSNMNLRGLNLVGANLKANLQHADIRNAKIKNAQFQDDHRYFTGLRVFDGNQRSLLKVILKIDEAIETNRNKVSQALFPVCFSSFLAKLDRRDEYAELNLFKIQREVQTNPEGRVAFVLQCAKNYLNGLSIQKCFSHIFAYAFKMGFEFKGGHLYQVFEDFKALHEALTSSQEYRAINKEKAGQVLAVLAELDCKFYQAPQDDLDGDEGSDLEGGEESLHVYEM